MRWRKPIRPDEPDEVAELVKVRARYLGGVVLFVLSAIVLAFVVVIATVLNNVFGPTSGKCSPEFNAERQESSAVPPRFCYRGSSCGPLTVVQPVGGLGKALGNGYVWSVLVAPDDRHVAVIWRGCSSLNRIEVHQGRSAVGIVVTASNCIEYFAPGGERWYAAAIVLSAPIGRRVLRNDGPPSYTCD